MKLFKGDVEINADASQVELFLEAGWTNKKVKEKVAKISAPKRRKPIKKIISKES